MNTFIEIGQVQIYRDVEGNGRPIICKGLLLNIAGEVAEDTQQVACIDTQNKKECYKCPARTIRQGEQRLVERATMVQRFRNEFRLGEIPV
jgi:hypothetical protein